MSYNNEKLNFEDKMLQRSNFNGQDLRRANFRYANLEGSDFSNADLSNADFRCANLENCNFKNAKLQGALLVGSYCVNLVCDENNLNLVKSQQVVLQKSDRKRDSYEARYRNKMRRLEYAEKYWWDVCYDSLEEGDFYSDDDDESY